MADERARPSRDERDDLIKRQQDEIARLREELARTERERDQLRRQNERLKQQLDAARRAGFRQAAPFAKDRRQGHDGQLGRRAGTLYGLRARRPIPARVDETYDAPLPATCPACAGAVIETAVATQYQEDLPPVRPCPRCGAPMRIVERLTARQLFLETFLADIVHDTS